MKGPDGTVRLIDKIFPLTVAVIPVLPEAALYVPDPPDSTTCAAPVQSFNVTVLELAVNADDVGHAFAPAPDPVTVIGTLEVPSVAVTVAPVNAPDGLARLMDTIFPLTVAITLELLEATL